MTGSLAWPVAAFAIAFLFRTQIRALITRLNEIGIGDAKAKFAQQLDAAEKKAETLPPPPEPAPEVPPEEPENVDADEEEEPTDETTEDQDYDLWLAHRKAVVSRYRHFGVESGKFAALLDIAPSAAILDTFRVVERALYRVAESKNVNVKVSRTSVRALAYDLTKAGHIPADVAQLIGQLQEMRNRAAHGAEPTVTDAIRFRDIATRVVAALREAAK